ncbi:MAG: hypothetical protein IJ743_04315, partial [Bacilli bacterium]|nr:hypothetical protein [Bacilli bacterium]
RDCYVSGTSSNNYSSIDTMKFRQDMKNLIEEMIKNHNEYMKYKTALDNNNFSARHMYETDCDWDSDDGCTCDVEWCNYYEVPAYSYTTWSASFDSVSVLMTSFNAVSTSASLNVNGEVTHERGSGYIESSSGCSSDVCHVGSLTNIKNYLTTQRDDYKKKYEANLEAIRFAVQQYNDCSGSITNASLGESSKSAGWENKMANWDTDGPEIFMAYNKDYKEGFNSTLLRSRSNISSNEEYCFGDTDSTYKCISGGSANNLSESTTTNNIVYCDDTHCYSMPITVGKSNWIRKTKVQSARYEPNNELSVRSQYGTIQFKSAACNGNDCLYTNLPSDSIPVSLLTKTGVFPFVLSYNKVGQSNQDNSLGRIINTGSTKSVLTEYTRKVNSGEYKKCSISTMQQQVGYVCHYLTNCDDHCKFKCDPDGKCYFEECEDGNCTFSCRDCIFDGDNFTYSFRPVSLSTLFPNERSKNSDEGYNWTNDYKGQLTRKIIENGYNRGAIKLQGGDESYVTPEYSYTVSAINLKNIKDYNSEVGTFANSTIPSKYENMSNNTTTPKNSAIYCSNMSINGIDYSVKCNSAFLDVIENDASHKFAIASVRPDKSQRFVLFTDLVSVDPELQKTCANNNCITRENAIGPSWK